MALSEKTVKMLWGRAGGRCSLPDCRMELFHSDDEATIPTLVGENCHIVAESDNGPRADASLPLVDRNNYPNLILLCRNHHKVIDDIPPGPIAYPVERLQKIKVDHEGWVKDQLGFDQRRQFEEEQFAEILDTWQALCQLNNWLAWSSHMLNPQPSMSVELDTDFGKLRKYLLSRVWPTRYPELIDAFNSFSEILEDLRMTFLRRADNSNPNRLIAEKFYKIRQWDDKLYHRLLAEYEWHVDLIADLVLELTRAANRICDVVRATLDHRYRLKEGKLMVQRGPNADLSFVDFVVEYTKQDLEGDDPYKSLEQFIEQRVKRKIFIGKGKLPALAVD